MVAPITEHQGIRSTGLDRPSPIVAFDFDGTMTVRDTFLTFLRWREGGFGYCMGMLRLWPAALVYLFNRDAERLKVRCVRVFLKGLPREVLEEEAKEFATVAAPMLLRPDALKVWRRYRQEGMRLVIVTASPEIIIAPFARGLGADLLLGTRLEFDADSRVSGGFIGANCRGQEKVNRLREVFGHDMRLSAAYGDTAGYREMLALAEDSYMRLFTGRPGGRMRG